MVTPLKLSNLSMLELIDEKIKMYRLYNIALRYRCRELQVKLINYLRVICAEIHVAHAENRI